MKRISAFFQRFFATAPLHHDVAEQLAQLCVRRQFSPGDVIFDQGDAVNAFYWISEGEVELRLAGNTLKMLQNSQLMAEDAVFDGVTTHEYAAIALTDIELIEVNAAGFMQLVQVYPALGLQLLKAVSSKCHDLPEQDKDNAGIDPLAFFPQYFMPANNTPAVDLLPTFHFFQE